MSDHDTATRTGRIVVHLVHGTWAENAPWTQPGSFFRERLQRRLWELEIGTEIEFTAPQWGGQNRQSVRLAGVEKVRDEVRKKASEGGVRICQLLVGHSHGGSVCFLACKDGERSIASEVDGVVCLSTPFLVFRRAPYLRWMSHACCVAWLMVAMIAARVLLVDNALKAALLSLPVLIAYAAFRAWASRYGYSEPEVITVPKSLPVPTLLIRCPGDEASGVLGASLVVERVMVLLTAKVASVWEWMNRHRLVYLLFAVLLGLTVSAAMFASMALSGSLEALKWPAIVLAALFALVLVVPLLLGFPSRSLLYWFSYGSDVATRGVFLDVSAESTPPGAWLVHTIFPRRFESGLPGLAHSEPYDNEEAIDIVARWVGKLVERTGARVGREQHDH
ncbi:MAG: hypothetical protein XU15_C0008G0039 [candidate division NC10 bacterium CSP1-5]|nr:MAG: hypothetical protein XU15_C0008G0039 [candidate division NC10 bacterium CSP1-5]